MDPYDSDSSAFDDAEDYAETDVLLGYAEKEPGDDTISHLGGWPVRATQSCDDIRIFPSLMAFRRHGSMKRLRPQATGLNAKSAIIPCLSCCS